MNVKYQQMYTSLSEKWKKVIKGNNEYTLAHGKFNI